MNRQYGDIPRLFSQVGRGTESPDQVSSSWTRPWSQAGAHVDGSDAPHPGFAAEKLFVEVSCLAGQVRVRLTDADKIRYNNR